MADVWMKWCTKQAKCKWCEEPIVSGTPMVMVKIWRKKEESNRFTITLRFHPQCWVNQALNSLDEFVARRLQLSDEERKTRKRLIWNYAITKHRLRGILDSGNFTGSKVDVLINRLKDIINQIESVGGVPKGWPGYVQN